MRAAATALFAIVASGRAARAGGGPPTDAYEGIADTAVDVHALADVYYAQNFDDPSSGQSALRAFDTTANEPALGWLRVRVARRPRTFGFRVDLGVGDVANGYFADDPASTLHPALSRWLSHVGQAFATVAPIDHLAIDAGKFDTPIGLEDNEALANWNYSRSFVYTWDEPSLHTGLRATYEIDPELALAAFWLNGWNANVLDGNTMRSYAVAARYKPVDGLELVAVYAGGLEPALVAPHTALAFRNLVDGYLTYAITGWLSVAATGDYATQFHGAAGYARVAPLRDLALAARVERFADRQGAATGTAQTLDEITATLEGRRKLCTTTLVARLELRHDRSTATVFDNAGTAAHSQDTLTLALLVSR